MWRTSKFLYIQIKGEYYQKFRWRIFLSNLNEGLISILLVKNNHTIKNFLSYSWKNEYFSFLASPYQVNSVTGCQIHRKTKNTTKYITLLLKKKKKTPTLLQFSYYQVASNTEVIASSIQYKSDQQHGFLILL